MANIMLQLSTNPLVFAELELYLEDSTVDKFKYAILLSKLVIIVPIRLSTFQVGKFLDIGNWTLATELDFGRFLGELGDVLIFQFPP
jgi:hypothetical protein